MADKLVAINTDDPHGEQFAQVVNDEILFLIGQQGGGGVAGPPGADGQDGTSVTYKSTVMRVEDLPKTANPGDMYWVETPVPTTAFIWDGATSKFVAAGRVQGDPGADGQPGAPGADGADGADGAAGADGTPATVTLGTTTTLAPGSDATVTNTGTTPSDAIFNFGIPAGADGTDGISLSIQGSVPTYADLPADAAPGEAWVVEGDGKLYDHDGDGFPPDGAGVPWVGKQGVAGPPGSQGIGLKYVATVADEASLPASANQGDVYVVQEPAPARGFVWDEGAAAWVDAGPVQGPPGVDGRDGIDGAPGADGAVGPAGPVAVSADANNASRLGSDGLIFTPQAEAGTPYTLPPATTTTLGGLKVGTGLSVTADGTVSAAAATGFLPLSGGTMTGTITLPSGSVAMAVNGTNYNMLGGSGGVAFRSGTTNILNHTASEVVAYVPITTAGTGVGVRFGSGGPSLSKSGTTIAASAPITVAAAPTGGTELANKAYVDSAVAAGGGGGGTAYTLPPATASTIGGVKPGAGLTVAADGTLAGVANPVSGSVANMALWTGTQSQYDAIASKSATTVYFITA
jgi:hypothetical protein